ncbi:methylated-DNA--[protein]-cysteine S-methyltransferase [Cloacibacillus sp. An23]|uniref:methylated-DNA--[protein]-cysteine S-methyltransferase n=1 Tax=Cloacibacillus sp. An23 TaxID=1965591 RepID=UPI000B379E66|nr:methylated-DNA--[protein]-cysteine S-methyltransferase [Cloacibacillus sp. An23]OUO94263.1 cysteine methyltransferase [Cloacibacillus sp. An23]
MKLCFEGVGNLLLSEEGGRLTGLSFLKGRPAPEDLNFRETQTLLEAKRQLEEYFDGSRRGFDIPLAPMGTPFQLRCWDALLKIPYGRTATYADIARAVGSPKAFRAVGLANNRNPIAIIIPCHRVIGSNGRLVGFGGGLDVKAFLLRFEAAMTVEEQPGAQEEG